MSYARARLPQQLAVGAAPRRRSSRRSIYSTPSPDAGLRTAVRHVYAPGLLLHDPARLLRLLTNPERPVQLIIAGKAHPQDHVVKR